MSGGFLLDLVFELNHYVTTVWFLDEQNAPTFGKVAISWEDGYVYMVIVDPNVHIFGSVDPEATPEEVKTYFADFLRIFRLND